MSMLMLIVRALFQLFSVLHALSENKCYIQFHGYLQKLQPLKALLTLVVTFRQHLVIFLCAFSVLFVWYLVSLALYLLSLCFCKLFEGFN